MYAIETTITCQCEGCSALTITTSNVPLSPLSTENLSKMLGREDTWCAICYSKMAVRDIKCKITKNVYGNIQTGEWFCPKHPSDIYYPYPLEKVKNDPTYSMLTRYQKYKKIAEVGFPWKCPICSSTLIYKERKYLNDFHR